MDNFCLFLIIDFFFILAHAGQIVINSSEELLIDPVLPLAEKVGTRAMAVYHKEEAMRGYLKSATEDTSHIEGQLQDVSINSKITFQKLVFYQWCTQNFFSMFKFKIL